MISGIVLQAILFPSREPVMDLFPASSHSFWAVGSGTAYLVNLRGSVRERRALGRDMIGGWDGRGNIVPKADLATIHFKSKTSTELGRGPGLRYGETTVLEGSRFLTLRSAQGDTFLSDAFGTYGFTTSLDGSHWIQVHMEPREPVAVRFGRVGMGTRYLSSYSLPNVEGLGGEQSVALSPGGRNAFVLLKVDSQKGKLPVLERWKGSQGDSALDATLVRLDLRTADMTPLATLRGYFGSGDMGIRENDFVCVGRHLVVNFSSHFRVIENAVSEDDQIK